MGRYKLSKIVDIISGGTPKTSIKEYWEYGHICWLSINDFNNENRFVYDSEKKITELGLKNSNTKLLERGDLIISARGTVGVLAQIGKPMCFNQSCFGLRGRTGIVGNDFLYYTLKNYVSNIKRRKQGSVFDTINLSSFELMELEIPDLPTQQKIAAVLSALDEKIELNNKINAELEAMAKLIYDYWFVQFDFPTPAPERGENATKPYKSSGGQMVWSNELKREIPKGWEVKKISEIIEVKDGTHDSPKAAQTGYKLITSKHLKSGGLDFENAYFISEEDYKNINRRSGVETGDILYSMIGNIGTIYKVEETNINFAIKNIALYKTSQDETLKNFLYLFLSSCDMQTYLSNVIAGSIQKFIGLGSLRNMPILHNRKLIEMFVTKTACIFRQINTLNRQNQELAALRDWLLPMLMNGQVMVE